MTEKMDDVRCAELAVIFAADKYERESYGTRDCPADEVDAAVRRLRLVQAKRLRKKLVALVKMYRGYAEAAPMSDTGKINKGIAEDLADALYDTRVGEDAREYR